MFFLLFWLVGKGIVGIMVGTLRWHIRRFHFPQHHVSTSKFQRGWQAVAEAVLNTPTMEATQLSGDLQGFKSRWAMVRYNSFSSGFKRSVYFLCPSFGKWSNLTHSSQMGRNHQLLLDQIFGCWDVKDNRQSGNTWMHQIEKYYFKLWTWLEHH